jgi:SAM-dependent methyltransferase
LTVIGEREQAERRFWHDSETERPGAWSLELLTHKMAEARVLLEKLDRFDAELRKARTIVELGAGQGWASCMFKHQLGADTTVIATDLAADALESSTRWARVIGAHPDGRVACRSAELPVADASVDLVVAFASAHHFGAHRRTLREIARVLAPHGTALYLHEPACRAWVYPAAYRRVMAKRPAVPEDVLRYEEIVELASAAGLTTDVVFAPTTTYRAPIETLYYLALQRVPVLQRMLPCTVDLVFRPAGR